MDIASSRGGVALFANILLTYVNIKNGNLGSVFESSLYLSIWGIIVLFIIYYFSMPKKEIILNRLDGTITFPGWMWNKNITMPFDDIKFSYTSAGVS